MYAILWVPWWVFEKKIIFQKQLQASSVAGMNFMTAEICN